MDMTRSLGRTANMTVVGAKADRKKDWQTNRRTIRRTAASAASAVRCDKAVAGLVPVLHRGCGAGAKNVFKILLRDPDLPLNGTQHPHVLKYIPVFPCRLATTAGRSLQIVNTF